jgi:hypothetical protein
LIVLTLHAGGAMIRAVERSALNLWHAAAADKMDLGPLKRPPFLRKDDEEATTCIGNARQSRRFVPPPRQR